MLRRLLSWAGWHPARVEAVVDVFVGNGRRVTIPASCFSGYRERLRGREASQTSVRFFGEAVRGAIHLNEPERRERHWFRCPASLHQISSERNGRVYEGNDCSELPGRRTSERNGRVYEVNDCSVLQSHGLTVDLAGLLNQRGSRAWLGPSLYSEDRQQRVVFGFVSSEPADGDVGQCPPVPLAPKKRTQSPRRSIGTREGVCPSRADSRTGGKLTDLSGGCDFPGNGSCRAGWNGRKHWSRNKESLRDWNP